MTNAGAIPVLALLVDCIFSFHAGGMHCHRNEDADARGLDIAPDIITGRVVNWFKLPDSGFRGHTGLVARASLFASVEFG